MTTREKAQRYMAANYPNEEMGVYRVSKYYTDGELWFFTFPISYFDADRKGNVVMMLQRELHLDDFHYLKVPFSFFRDNESKFNIRESGEKFDLHLSAKKNNWLVCERSSGVEFSKYEQ